MSRLLLCMLMVLTLLLPCSPAAAIPPPDTKDLSAARAATAAVLLWRAFCACTASHAVLCCGATSVHPQAAVSNARSELEASQRLVQQEQQLHAQLEQRLQEVQEEALQVRRLEL